jgi:hypothetical protein
MGVMACFRQLLRCPILLAFWIETLGDDEDLCARHRALFGRCIVDDDCFDGVTRYLCERHVVNLMPQVLPDFLRCDADSLRLGGINAPVVGQSRIL